MPDLPNFYDAPREWIERQLDRLSDDTVAEAVSCVQAFLMQRGPIDFGEFGQLDAASRKALRLIDHRARTLRAALAQLTNPGHSALIYQVLKREQFDVRGYAVNAEEGCEQVADAVHWLNMLLASLPALADAARAADLEGRGRPAKRPKSKLAADQDGFGYLRRAWELAGRRATMSQQMKERTFAAFVRDVVRIERPDVKDGEILTAVRRWVERGRADGGGSAVASSPGKRTRIRGTAAVSDRSNPRGAGSQ